ncbi:MAG TPA: winged helix-turn-helix domain-containing protein [Rhodanobacteraceae bacterium]|nr:winged helix-turn-helix domain-containing protein [Rhodanobacteraceae bacterium]
MTPAPRLVYRFADCRIDLASRELRRNGQLVVLAPKVFDCLAYLIARNERAVGRDELVAAVWGRTEITDTLLGQTILKARRAVGDSADEQKAIRTIPRFGYAWVAELASDEAPAPRMPAGASSKRRAFRIAWLAPVIALLALAGFWMHRQSSLRAPVPSSDAAAVLPVEVDAPAEWSWVRLGLMDSLASRLREGDQSVVPSDNVVAAARAASDAPADIGRATGAALLIVPSARWSDSGWNVRLDVRGGDAPIDVEARDADVLLAGREAADQLLARLGKTPPADAGHAGEWADAKLLHRVEAALLTDDLDGARRLLQSASDALKASPEYGLRLAKIDFRAGDFGAAERRLRELLPHAPAEGDPVLRARILNGLGNVAMRLGRSGAATQAYGEAATLLEDRAEPADLGQAYMGRGSVAQMEGRFEDALADFSRAHVAFELAGDRLAQARVEANEGMLDAAREQFAAAATALDRAAVRFESFGTLNELAMTTSAAIGAHLALLEPRDALAASDRAWPLRDRISNPAIRAALAINRARALDANGRRREATMLLEDVVVHSDSERTRTVQAVARAELARVALAAGHATQAADLALAAFPAIESGDDPRDRVIASLVAARALRADGRDDGAVAEVAALAAYSQTRAQPLSARYAALALAEQRVAERKDADTDYQRALDLAVRANVPADIAEVAISYGSTLIAEGQLEHATAVIGQAARWTDRDLRCALLQVRLYAVLGQRPAWQHALAAAKAIAGDREIADGLTVFPSAPSSGSR